MQLLLLSVVRFWGKNTAEYVTLHEGSAKHCGTCCIWNHMLMGGLVSMHLPKQRALALIVTALLSLDAQAGPIKPVRELLCLCLP